MTGRPQASETYRAKDETRQGPATYTKPEWLTTKPLQDEGIKWLCEHQYGYLADEPGGGKTLQAVRAADAFPDECVLVICPKAAVETWAKHFSSQSVLGRPVRVLVTSDQMPRENEPLPGDLRGNCVFITSFDRVRLSWPQLHDIIKPRKFLTIIDEAHCLKSLRSTQAVRCLGWPVHDAQRVWFLSGTPMPNGWPTELWTIAWVIGATKMAYDDFIVYFCETAPRSGRGRYRSAFDDHIIVGLRKDRIPEFKDFLRPWFLRRKATDIDIKLDKIKLVEHVVELPGSAFDAEVMMTEETLAAGGADKLLAEFERQNLALGKILPRGTKVDDDARALVVLESAEPLFATWRKIAGLSLAESAAWHIAEMVTRDRPKHIVFGFHSGVLDILADVLGQFGPVFRTDGKTRLKVRRKNEREFQSLPPDQPAFFIGNLISASVAATLTAAADVHLVEQTFTPHHTVQGIRRAYRIGQKKSVCNVWTYQLASNPVHKRVMKLLSRKASAIAQALGTDVREDANIPTTVLPSPPTELF